MKVIITGGAGFVGSHLVELLITKNHYPIIIDNLMSGKKEYIEKFVTTKKAEFFKVDIRNIKELLKLPKTSAVIHLAAVASVVESIRNPTYVNEVNVNGTLNLLEFCKKKQIKKFVFTSSAAIYGNYEKKITEDTPTIPTTVYGATKLMGEHFCRIYSDLYGIKSVILRPFNIYGKRQNDSYAGVITKFIQRIHANKHPIIFGSGKQTRDFIHVKDVAKAFERALLFTEKNKFEVFNLATGKSVSINHLADTCLHFSSNKFKPIYRKAIPGVVIHSSTKAQKIKKILGFEQSITLSDGLKDLF